MNVQPDMFLWAEMKKHFEGCELLAYQDTGGVWTIGFGDTYHHDLKRRIRSGDRINFQTAVKWLEIAAAERIAQANAYIKVKLDSFQSVAICDYIYNRGIGNFIATNLDELINRGAPVDAICAEIVGTGLRDRAGNLLWGLGRRRRCQAYLYKHKKLKYEFPRWGKWDT